MKEYECLTCRQKFKSYDAYRSPKYCSIKCFSIRPIQESTRKKMSDAKRGRTPWNLGVKMWEGREHPKGTQGKPSKRKGTKATPETIKRLSESHRGKKYPNQSGERHWNWQNGKTPETEKARKSAEYAEWRRRVFERDEFTCVLCYKKGGYLHADHITPFSVAFEKRYDVVNGRTLCVSCHRKTDTYGGKCLRYRIKSGKDFVVRKNGEITQDFE